MDLLKENRIPFGRFPKKKNDKMSLSVSHQWDILYWHVLRREYNKVLLITEDLIGCRKYNGNFANVTWAKSSIRSWLNTEFLLSAFTENEKARIAWVCNQNPDNDSFEKVIKGGNPTWDRVFVLSIDEAMRYFDGSVARRAPVTSYAKSKGSYTTNNYIIRGNGAGWWWLRSPGNISSCAARVGPDGDIDEGGDSVNNSSVSVRPALWIYL